MGNSNECTLFFGMRLTTREVLFSNKPLLYSNDKHQQLMAIRALHQESASAYEEYLESYCNFGQEPYQLIHDFIMKDSTVGKRKHRKRKPQQKQTFHQDDCKNKNEGSTDKDDGGVITRILALLSDFNNSSLEIQLEIVSLLYYVMNNVDSSQSQILLNYDIVTLLFKILNRCEHERMQLDRLLHHRYISAIASLIRKIVEKWNNPGQFSFYSSGNSSGNSSGMNDDDIAILINLTAAFPLLFQPIDPISCCPIIPIREMIILTLNKYGPQTARERIEILAPQFYLQGINSILPQFVEILMLLNKGSREQRILFDRTDFWLIKNIIENRNSINRNTYRKLDVVLSSTPQLVEPLKKIIYEYHVTNIDIIIESVLPILIDNLSDSSVFLRKSTFPLMYSIISNGTKAQLTKLFPTIIEQLSPRWYSRVNWNEFNSLSAGLRAIKMIIKLYKESESESKSIIPLLLKNNRLSNYLYQWMLKDQETGLSICQPWEIADYFRMLNDTVYIYSNIIQYINIDKCLLKQLFRLMKDHDRNGNKNHRVEACKIIDKIISFSHTSIAETTVENDIADNIDYDIPNLDINLPRENKDKENRIQFVVENNSISILSVLIENFKVCKEFIKCMYIANNRIDQPDLIIACLDGIFAILAKGLDHPSLKTEIINQCKEANLWDCLSHCQNSDLQPRLFDINDHLISSKRLEKEKILEIFKAEINTKCTNIQNIVAQIYVDIH